MKFKYQPEDFVVEELTQLKPKKEGDYIYVRLKKTNWTTVRAIKTLARRLRVSKSRIGFSGNKDKNAVTSQVISIWKIKKETLDKLKIKDIDLKFLGYGPERINLGDHDSNQFKIRLRNVSKSELKNIEENLELIKKQGFPNYFGGQRFGINENSHLIGKCIILGDFERAVKRLLGKNPGKNWQKLLDKLSNGRRMERAVLHHLVVTPTDYAGALRNIEKPTRRIFIHAYQSWVFNKALSEILGESVKCNKVKFLDLILNFPKEDVENFKNKLPIIGTHSKLSKDKFSKTYCRILKEDGVNVEDFKCKRMPELASEGSDRTAFVKPQNLKISKDKKDVILSFTLEKGSYATMLLSALLLEHIK